MNVYFLMAIIWAILIFIGSSVPGSELPTASNITSYIVHFIEYLVLGVLLALSAKAGLIKGAFEVLIIGLLYALSDEIHQLFVPGREFSLLDLLLDALGLYLGLKFILRSRHS